MTPETFMWVRFGVWGFACLMAGIQVYTQIQDSNKSAALGWVCALLTLMTYGAPEKCPPPS